MEMNGARQRLVTLARDELVPMELTIGCERIEVFLDHSGIHFQQQDSPTKGHLSWELAIALALVPEQWRRSVRAL